MSELPPVTLAITNYNGGDVLLETVDSFRRLDYPAFSMLVIDNASSDDSLAQLAARHPDVRAIRLGDNGGPPASRNVGLRESRTDLVFLTDNDVVAEPDMLRRLVERMMADERTAIVSPRTLYSDGSTVLSDGVRLHYLGLSMPRHRRLAATDVQDTAPCVCPCASGGMMLVHKARIGPDTLFDEDYFFAWDDVEFSYRLSLRGFSVVTVPEAVVCHREKTWGTKRSFWQVRNRWYLLLTAFSTRTLLLCTPMLLVYEAGLVALMLAKREVRTYLRAMREVVKLLDGLRDKRRRIQASRKVGDRDLLAAGDIYIEAGLVSSRGVLRVVRLGNRFFDLYWKLVRPLL